MRGGMLAALACVALTLGCDAPASPDAKGSAKAQPEAPIVELTPEHRIAMAKARVGFIRAWRAGTTSAIAKSRSAAARAQAAGAKAKPPEQARRAAIVFSGNNNGEREDCGCKRNPLGGLARRGTMIDEARAGGDASRMLWGERGAERVDALFYADAGNFLFADGALYKRKEDRIADQVGKARKVLAGMEALAPDAVAVGEREMSNGWASFEALTKGTKLPFVSANLRVGGKAPLPSHVVVERAGVRVAFVGLTDDREDNSGHYEHAGIEVLAPKAEYASAVASIDGEVDLVVMLSNLGVVTTRELVGELRAEGVRVDAAFVSGSGSMTTRVTWDAGTPHAEPSTRGKYVGRADFWLVGEQGAPVDYANDVPDVAGVLQAYSRGVESYTSNRAMTLEREIKLVEARRKVEQGAGVPEDGKDTTLGSAYIDEAKKKLEHATKDHAFALKRTGLMQADLARAAAKVDASMLTPKRSGDDWFESRVVPVKITIEEKKSVKRAIDRTK